MRLYVLQHKELHLLLEITGFSIKYAVTVLAPSISNLLAVFPACSSFHEAGKMALSGPGQP